MRIVGGKYKSTALANVGKGDAGAHLRPTTDRVRESLFNLLVHGNYPSIEGARVLDLFAGTGALGLEALSRGAAFAQLVDDGAKAGKLIKENIGILGVREQAQLYRQNATRMGACRAAPYDWVFLDPPYGKKLGEMALASCVSGGWIADGALVIWEENTTTQPPAGFSLLDMRRYGDTNIGIYRYAILS